METQISISPALSGIYNMEMDQKNFEFIDQREISHHSHPCLVRIYEWDEPTISLGISQKKMTDSIFKSDQPQLKTVERMTGGRMVLHHREITYSVTASLHTSFFGSSLQSTYKQISRILVAFLKRLGLDADISEERTLTSRSLVCYDLSGWGEIMVEGKKLIGSAQKRGEYTFLQHGSIPFYPHDFRLENYLKPIYLPKHPVDYIFLGNYVGEDIETAKEMLKKTFEDFLG